MLDLYLSELGRELSRTLPPEDVALRLAEAEGHLREGVEGRVELGLDEAEAAREAIASFGAARRLAAAGRPAHEGRATSRLTILGAGYGLALAFALFGWRLMDALPSLNVWLFQAWFVLGIGFAIAAFRARRPRPGVVGATVLGGAVLTWLVLGASSLNLYAFGGSGLVPPGSLSSFVEDDRRLLAERTQARADFDAGWSVLRGSQGVEGLRSAAGYPAPVVQQPSYGAPLRYERIPDAKAALRAWSDVRQRGANLFDTETLTMNLRAAEAARAAPLRNLLSLGPDLLTANLGLAAFAMLVDYAFGGLGTLALRLRRRRKGATVA